jgi:hypothetical protein
MDWKLYAIGGLYLIGAVTFYGVRSDEAENGWELLVYTALWPIAIPLAVIFFVVVHMWPRKDL